MLGTCERPCGLEYCFRGLEGNTYCMLAWLQGWEISLIVLVVLFLFSGNLGGGSSGGGGFGIHPLTVRGDILEWIVKAKEELWVRLSGKQK